MKIAVLVLSICAVVTLVIFGAVGFFIGTFGFDTTNPYNTPFAVITTVAGLTPGLALTIAAFWLALASSIRFRWVGWTIALIVWPVMGLAVAVVMFLGMLSDASSWWLTFAFMPLAPLAYAITAPPAPVASGAASVATPTNTPSARPAATGLRLAAFYAILLIAAAAGVTTLVMRAAGAPSLNGGVTGPSALRVSYPTTGASCAAGVYPPVTLTNAGSSAIQWSAQAADAHLIITPSTGSLGPGQSTQIVISGQTQARSVIVIFQPSRLGGPSAVAKFGC